MPAAAHLRDNARLSRRSVSMKLARLLDLLPQACLLCGDHAGARSLCAACHASLPWQRGPACTVCALPLSQAGPCGSCLRAPPAFDHSIAAWDYAWPLDRLIPALKYGSELILATALADGLARQLATRPADERPDALLAMPLHPQRLRERGFNQSQLLARRLARATGLPLHQDLVERIKLTPPQASLPREERRRTIRHAFRVCGEVRGLHLAVVDDVMTTGASLDELALTLKQAGARRVDCWVLARTA